MNKCIHVGTLYSGDYNIAIYCLFYVHVYTKLMYIEACLYTVC